ncbi:MAG: hypothetical protein JW705_07140 [Methanosarcinaceae archaeon]|nr:hypothetical protein [Methanosarcinaceae archaeon]
MALSREDLKGAVKGLPFIFITLVAANTLSLLIYANAPNAVGEIFRYNIYLLAFSILSILFSGINLLLSYLAWSIKKEVQYFK